MLPSFAISLRTRSGRTERSMKQTETLMAEDGEHPNGDLPPKWWTPRKGSGMLIQEVVTMGRTRRAFTQEFKREAVKLVTEGGHPIAQVA